MKLLEELKAYLDNRVLNLNYIQDYSKLFNFNK